MSYYNSINYLSKGRSAFLLPGLPWLSLSTALAVAAADSPIAVTGYNRAVIVERAATGGNTAEYAQAFDVANGYCFYEAGLVVDNYSGGNSFNEGLPQGGAFTSILDGLTTFQLGPYDGNNVLFMSEGSATGTLNLVAPQTYSSLSVLACSANGGAAGSLVIQFADRSSSPPIAYNAPDWYNNPGSALTHFGRLYFGNNSQFLADNPPGNDPNLYQTKIDLTSLGLSAKAITSVTFTMPGGAGTSAETDTGIFALSGTPTVAATPSSASSEAYTFTTLAGTAKTGSTDGVGTSAQFNFPDGVAVDSAGNIYVADTGNDTLRKVTPSGIVTTLAGVAGTFGYVNGIGSMARFEQLSSVAVDNKGNVYVADYSSCAIRKVTPAGVVTTLAGGNQGSQDGTGSAAQFNAPQGVAVDSAGNVFVADRDNNTIRKVTSAGVVTTLAGLAGITGSADGTGTQASFSRPAGVAVDSAGNVYVADQYNSTIRKVTRAGVVTTLAGLAGTYGSTDGTGSSARFSQPASVAVDSAGDVYVADMGNSTIRKVTPSGVVTTLAGQTENAGFADGTGTSAQFYFPQGVAVDANGNVYVADTYNSLIREITPAAQVTTVAGASTSQGSTDGTGKVASFNQPTGVAAGANGDVYVADTDNSIIRKVTSAGDVITVAGLAGSSRAADGVGTDARFDYPTGVTVDSAGNVYVSDTGNSTIRMISPAGVVSTIAGMAGSSGGTDGTNGSARFNNPWGLAVDRADNIYVADSGNNTIRKMIPAGTASWVVKTIAGIAGISGSSDDAGVKATFYGPKGVAVDGAGNVYVADSLNLTIRILQPLGSLNTTNYIVSTIAGSVGENGFQDGVGTNALFGGYAGADYGPAEVAVDSAGNLYVADSFYNQMIRKITPQITPHLTTWLVSTIGGSPGAQGSANGAGSSAEFDTPQGITVDSAGSVYVADTRNNTIRKGVFSQYTPINTASFIQPINNGALVVSLLPAEANGQWKFPWELSWRDSGEAATNLVQGEYPVEFRTEPGYLIFPLVAIANDGTTVTNLVAVIAGETTYVTNQYYLTVSTVNTNNGGSLTVNIGPSPPNGAGWRFLGDTGAFYPPDSSTNLAVGTYLIEFAPVGGFITPSSLSLQVMAGAPTVLAITYLLASAPPSGVLLPTPVPASDLSDLADYPYGFNGQLQTDVGYGSGVAVQTNVVLTAAHLIFNDQTLSYVSDAYWFFHEEAEVYTPEPLQARGWYVLSGYAATRTNDVVGGLGPDQSSPQSRNFDVAALYFESPVANGNYGGYLSSDATPNSWLTSTAEKMLVGYPVDGSQFGLTNIVNGQMYEIGPQPYALSQATDPVADQQVYTASWMLSFPGNSGGPFYVQFDGYYYPAGVYLGTLFNGVTPYASAVRAIDSNVVNLITLAATMGDSGTNNSGGGVIIIISTGVSSSHPAYLFMTLGPSAVVAAGAAWEFTGQPSKDYLSASQSVQELSSSTVVGLQFLPVSGWNLPSAQTVTLVAGDNSYTASYTVAVEWAAPSSIASGTALSSQQLNATTITSGSYVYSPPVGTVLSPGSYTLSVTFTPSDPNNYGGPSTTNVSLVVLSAAAPPVIQTAQRSGSSFTFNWSATASQTYQIQSTANLANPNWINVVSLIATNSTMSASQPIATNSQQFFRIVLVP
jgi:sugar lactone lactonase YvrE